LFVLSTNIDTNGTGSLTATLSGSSDTGVWSDEPLAGMDYVRIGNTATAASSSRQGAIYLTSDDDNAPYIDVVDGVTHHGTFNSSGNIKARMGKLSGITSPTFGTLPGYGFYASGSAYLEGTINATAGGYIGGWSINADSITSPSSIIKLSSADKRISINDGSQDRIWLGEVDGGTTYGMKIFDGVGQADDDILVELGEGGNIIAGWEISGSRIHKYNGSNGGLILDATNLRYDVYSGSANYDGNLVRMGQLDDSNNFGISGNDTSGNLLFKLGMLGNEIAGWEISGSRINKGNISLNATTASLRVSDDTRERVRVGDLDGVGGYSAANAKRYGVIGFDGTGTLAADVMFELSNARNVIAGWSITTDAISKTQISLNATIPSLRVSDGSTERIRVGDLKDVGGYTSTDTNYGIIGF